MRVGTIRELWNTKMHKIFTCVMRGYDNMGGGVGCSI